MLGQGCDGRNTETLDPRSYFAEPALELIGSRPGKPGRSLTVYRWRTGEVCVEHAADSNSASTNGRAVDGKDATGVTLWPAAFALCEWLIQRHHSVPQSRSDSLVQCSVLELGAGCGLPGLVAAELKRQGSGANQHGRVLLTDAVDGALCLLRDNIECMQCLARVHVRA